MATIRQGESGALVVVDVQVGVMAETWEPERIVANVVTAVERARSTGVPVMWVQHTDDELPTGSPQWEWVAELAPADGEARVHKRYNSAFEETTLDDELADVGATHLVLAGAATNWCVRATAYGALDRGYDVTLLADAHTTGSMPVRPDHTIEAADVIDDLNLVMTWVSYPGRSTAAVPTADWDPTPLVPGRP